MIIINEDAKAKIKDIMSKNPGKYLRIVVEGDGCAGPYLGVTLDEAEENEVPTRINGVDILVSEQARRYAEVATINVFMNYTGEDSY